MTSLLDSASSIPPFIHRPLSLASNRSQLSATSTLSIGDLTKRKKRKKRSLSSAKWRSMALEKTYVHDVYSLLANKSILLDAAHTEARPNRAVYDRVRSFLQHQTEPASIVLDLGCGDSNYSLPNDLFVMIGLDRCSAWLQNDSARPHGVRADLLRLPFKDAFFDAILCVDVLHHLSTVRRRISALKQISRCLKIGGKVLITVRGPSPKLRHFESRDLLIRVNHLKPPATYYESDYDDDHDDDSSFDDSDESDSDSDSDRHCRRMLNGGSIPYSYSHQKRRDFQSSVGSVSDSFASPSGSDLDDCYAFMKRALKRLSMIRGFYAQKNDNPNMNGSYVKKPGRVEHSVTEDSEEQLFAIELRNLDPDADYDITDSSTLASCSSPVSGPTTSSSGFFSASFLSNIREHFMNWRCQFVNNSVWHSLDAKLAIFNDAQQPSSEPPSHRFSLPLNFLKPEPTNNKMILARNKIHVYSSNKPAIAQLFSGERSFKLNLTESITSRLNILEEGPLDSRPPGEQAPREAEFHSNNNETFASNLSRFDGPRWQRTHYRSVPDMVECLREQYSHNKRHRSLQTLPLTGQYPDTPNWFEDSCSVIEETALLLEDEAATHNKGAEIVTPVRCKSAPLNRKLMRQRSFSADYQQPEIEGHDVPARRFSASPNIETHRYNNSCHTPHSQQISMDSEESFITIIPAMQSARASITDPNTFENLTDFDEEDEIEMSENDVEDMFSLSDENDDDAYCESLSCTSTDNTSLSSGLELTVKSLIGKSGRASQTATAASNHDSEDGTELSSETSQADEPNDYGGLFDGCSSAPLILHCFYHVFSSDELESLIRNYITDLDLLETVFEPETGTWCVVAEKIRVWTI